MFKKKYNGKYAGNGKDFLNNQKIPIKIKIDNEPPKIEEIKIEDLKTEPTAEKKPYYSSSHNTKNFADYAHIFIEFIFKYKIIIGLCFITGLVLFIALLVSDYSKIKGLVDYRPETITRIYDKNGKLISELFQQKRELIEYEKIPKDLINAFIAMEDNEFYDHLGINPKGIARAFFVNILSGRVKQGGSTITQQLSKILLTSGKRNIFRKIHEAFIALMLEANYSKDEIMSMYLNQIYMGHGALGVETASKFYFKKHVYELNIAECALLATLPSAPNLYSPIKNPNLSQQLHRTALARMVDLGYITRSQAEKAYMDFWKPYLALINDIPPTSSTWTSREDNAPWFTEYVRRILVKKFGEETVYTKGLSVYTTLDLEKQETAQKLLEERLIEQTKISSSMAFTNEDFITENFYSTVTLMSYLFDINDFSKKGSLENKKFNDYVKADLLDEFEMVNYFNGPDSIDKALDKYRAVFNEDIVSEKVEGAIISIDQNTGYIEAMVGGSEFKSINQLHRAVQAYRQAGSSIKPLLYTAAMESKKFTPATGILDAPVLYLDYEGTMWTPENYEEDYSGFVRLRNALAKSINVVSVRIAETLGIDTVMKYYAKLLKMSDAEAKQRIQRNYSIAIGTVEVTPLEMARAYSIIANGGKDVQPFAIKFVKNANGKIIDDTEKEIKEKLAAGIKNGSGQIIEPSTSEIMISLLKTVVSAGTGGAANIGRPVAGKTGTTNSWKDAWFIGFTPDLTTCVWIGYDSQGRTLGKGQTGGAVAAPLWGKYMRQVLRNQPARDFPHYADLVTARVCSVSGKALSSSCPSAVDEVFIPGTVPEDVCNICKGTSLDSKKAPEENLVQKQKYDITDSLKDLKGATDKDLLKDIGKDITK